jgi:hypothetical protein
LPSARILPINLPRAKERFSDCVPMRLPHKLAHE